MGRYRSFTVAAALAAVCMPACAQAASISPGVYLCKAGNARMMLTLGEMTISGTAYRFHAPTGADTEGIYEDMSGRFVWHGDIGAITNSQIVESGLDGIPNAFWFSYRARPTSLPTTASCSK